MWQMRLNAINITAVVAVVMMLAAGATGIYQLGRLSNQVDNLAVQIELLRDEMHRNNQELRDVPDAPRQPGPAR